MRARNKRPSHRPLIPIDWKEVDRCLEDGCNGVEIAKAIGMHYETFYQRVEIEKQVGFTEYAAQKRAKGLTELRKWQRDVARSLNPTMLIWLGKQDLDQREPESKTMELCRPALLEYLDMLKKKPE